ncbi:kinase [Planomicrobium sp. MB-3u-38]|uniref:kinase n=1 Tax=Planomicrobium sp. MB-3u-38 TaxID=2058318 RepID=UPI001E62B5CB|nr:kinase [Planomicrobium sp. MB-3u-38]
MEELITQITERLPAISGGIRLVVGIDGLSRSGKTTLTAKLLANYEKENIPVISFHLDDLIVERERRYGTGKAEWYEYYQLQWETEWLREHFFGQLKTAEELALPFYDPQMDRRESRKVALPETGIIIIEGVFLQRSEWRGLCDYVVYVDSAQEQRFYRESAEAKRNIEKFQNRYWKAEDYYLKSQNPQSHADFIVRN